MLICQHEFPKNTAIFVVVMKQKLKRLKGCEYLICQSDKQKVGRTRSPIQPAKISLLLRVSGLTPRDRMRNSVIWEGLREELLLLLAKSQLRCWDASSTPPMVWCAGPAPQAGDPLEDPGHVGGTILLGQPGKTLGFPWRRWSKWLERGRSESLCFDCCPSDPITD